MKKGPSVQVSNVVFGEVGEVRLNDDGYAQVGLRIDDKAKIALDSIVSVKSQSIIGDRYLQVMLGGDAETFEEDDLIGETESAVDIESLISKVDFGSAK